MIGQKEKAAVEEILEDREDVYEDVLRLIEIRRVCHKYR